MEEPANIYYDVQGTGTPAMKYERGNLLVLDDEYKNLTTYMRSPHVFCNTPGVWLPHLHLHFMNMSIIHPFMSLYCMIYVFETLPTLHKTRIQCFPPAVLGTSPPFRQP